MNATEANLGECKPLGIFSGLGDHERRIADLETQMTALAAAQAATASAVDEGHRLTSDGHLEIRFEGEWMPTNISFVDGQIMFSADQFLRHRLSKCCREVDTTL